MSRIKNMSRGGWIVIGILIAMMLVPSGVAVAKALKYTGIEGSDTYNSTINKAAVLSSGQLLTTESNPFDSFAGWNSGGTTLPSTNVTSSTCTPFGDMPLPQLQSALITQVNISVYSPPSSSAVIYVYPDGNCSGNEIVNDEVPNTLSGTQVIPFSPPVPTDGPDGFDLGGSGDYLSAIEYGGVSANIVVNGYVTTSEQTPG